MSDIEFDSPMSKKLDGVYRKLKKIEEALEETKQAVQLLQAEEKKEIFKHIPGIEGTFDGESMITSEGKSYEVPANYAAKSKLVYGDMLKLVELDGKEVFKQVEKVERREMLAILSKKEGVWYALTDSGSYRISDTAAEHNNLQLNDEAIILVPETNLSAPFAALDEMVTKREKPALEKTTSPKPPSKSSGKKRSSSRKPSTDKRIARGNSKPDRSEKSAPESDVNTIRELKDDDLV